MKAEWGSGGVAPGICWEIFNQLEDLSINSKEEIEKSNNKCPAALRDNFRTLYLGFGLAWILNVIE